MCLVRSLTTSVAALYEYTHLDEQGRTCPSAESSVHVTAKNVSRAADMHYIEYVVLLII